MNTAALATVGNVEHLPVMQSETTAMISMFERLARDPSVPMERIERVRDMLGQLRKEQAEEAFNEAMAQAQREMTSIARDSFNPQTRSKYASYHAIDKALRPIRTKQGIGVSFDEGDNAPEGHVRVLAFITKGRHTRTHHYDSPIVTKGLKGNDMMTLTHGRASAVMYARRYLMGMVFDLSTGEDNDGNDAGGAADTITQTQADTLRELIEANGKDRAAFLKWAKVERIEDIAAAAYDSCVTAANYKAPAK